MSDIDWGGWASYAWRLALAARSDPDVALLENVILGVFAVGITIGLLAIKVGHSARPKQRSKAQTKEPPERKHQSSSWFERFLEWLAPPGDPWKVGNRIVDFTWLAHCLVWGTTGSGKSTFVMERILRSPLGLPGLVVLLIWCFTRARWPKRERRGCLVFAGNYSAPFRAACLWLLEHGYPVVIWEPEPKAGAGFGMDWLEGPPDSVGQRLIKMQPSSNGDTGLRSGAVEGMLVDTIYVIDRNHEARTPGNILKYIKTVGIRDLDEEGNPVGAPRPLTTQEKAGLENWCTRFSTLRRRLGACIGDDYKLSELLAQGYVVFVQGSSYTNPNSINELTNLFVYTVMWLVGAVGNFDLIIDEPGAVEKGTFSRLLTATRAGGVRIFICPQSLEQIDKSLREMCTTVLLLGTAAGAHEAQELASDMVHKDIEPVDFKLLKPVNWRERVAFWRQRRGLRSCSGYLLDNGRLDFVKVRPAGCKYDSDNHKRKTPKHTRRCRLAIIDRWPKGAIPKLHGQPEEISVSDEASSTVHEAAAIAQRQSGPVPTGRVNGRFDSSPVAATPHESGSGRVPETFDAATSDLGSRSSPVYYDAQTLAWDVSALQTQSPEHGPSAVVSSPLRRNREESQNNREISQIPQAAAQNNATSVDWEMLTGMPDEPLLDQRIKPYILECDDAERNQRMRVWGHFLPLGKGRDGQRVEGTNLRGEITPCRIAKDGLRKSDGRPTVSYRGSKELSYVCIFAWANNVDWVSLKAMLSDKRTPVQLRPSVHHTCGHTDCGADDHLELRTVRRNSQAGSPLKSTAAAAD